MKDDSPVYVLDDDADVRDSLAALLRAAGFVVRAFGRADDLLKADLSQVSCVLTDIRMPGMDGLELQEELIRQECTAPVILMTGHGDVTQAVRAMKAGALDFVEKPFEGDLLLHSVRRAVEIGAGRQTAAANVREARESLAVLTPREREVLAQLVIGRSNKVAAHELGISPRTVEIHRAHLMEKLKARSLSDLVRLSLAAAA